MVSNEVIFTLALFLHFLKTLKINITTKEGI
jgi:hypothetical protein